MGKKSMTCRSPHEEAASNDEENNLRETGGLSRPKNDRQRRVASKVSYKEESESDKSSGSEFHASEEEEDGSNSSDEDFEIPSRKQRSLGTPNSRVAVNNRRKLTPPPLKVSKNPETVECPSKKRVTPSTSNPSKKRKKTISSSDEDIGKTDLVKLRGTDQWVEVFLEREEKWVCVDCVHGTVGQPPLCFKYATKPVCYIIGIDNDGCVKDVTQRYDPAWMTSTRKNRIDAQWWEDTLGPCRSPFVEREKKEEQEVNRMELVGIFPWMPNGSVVPCFTMSCPNGFEFPSVHALKIQKGG